MEDMETSEEEMAVSISAVGAVAYICCTVTFILLVCLLFFLGLTPTQRSVMRGHTRTLLHFYTKPRTAHSSEVIKIQTPTCFRESVTKRVIVSHLIDTQSITWCKSGDIV